MSTGKVDESQPILRLLAPPNTEAASFAEPTESALDNPATSRIAQLTRDRALFNFGFISPAPVLDMSNILFLFNHLMDVIVVVAFVGTQVLLDLLRVGPLNHNRDDEVIRRPLVMLIGCGNVDREGSTMLVNQQVNFAAALASIGRIAACLYASQRCWTRFAIYRLPCPANRLSTGIEYSHLRHYGLKDAPLAPGLEPFVQRTAAHPKPVPVDGLPLTACPHDIPDAIQDRPVVGTRSPWSTRVSQFWQQSLDLIPQRIRCLEVVHIFRLCVSILAQDVSSLEVVLTNLLSNEVRPFVQLRLIYG